MKEIIAKVVAREDLSTDEMQTAMERILAGEADPLLVAGLAVALRMKGETAEEIAAAARVMRARCDRVELVGEGPLLDTAGTGGDGIGTFNISTVAAIVAASCGVRVAKHGNRAVSSKCGSADVLEALGVRIDASPDEVVRAVREVGIAFLFAPNHHQALRHAAPVRKALGLRTFFNLLGPLANPAGATHQVVGVYEAGRVRQMAEVLRLLGVQAAWVVHGEGGLDEVSPAGVTTVARLWKGRVEELRLTPHDFGLEPVPLEELVGGDGPRNAAIARQVLSGVAGAPRTAVVINAAAALCVSGIAESPRDGATRAVEALDSGRAEDTLNRWIALGRRRD